MRKAIEYTFITTLIVSLLFSIEACNSGQKAQNTDPLVAHIDSTVKPGDDFFLFANGKWFKQHPIPASEGSNGLWLMVQDTINAEIRQICVSAASMNAQVGSNKQKISYYFYLRYSGKPFNFSYSN